MSPVEAIASEDVLLYLWGVKTSVLPANQVDPGV
jgi:hypothetical protein